MLSRLVAFKLKCVVTNSELLIKSFQNLHAQRNRTIGFGGSLRRMSIKTSLLKPGLEDILRWICLIFAENAMTNF